DNCYRAAGAASGKGVRVNRSLMYFLTLHIVSVSEWPTQTFKLFRAHKVPYAWTCRRQDVAERRKQMCLCTHMGSRPNGIFEILDSKYADATSASPLPENFDQARDMTIRPH